MSFESINFNNEETQENEAGLEEIKSFEDVDWTRDFGTVDFYEMQKIEKEQKDYWRIPTTKEFFALFRKNKKKFFKNKRYWAIDSTSRIKSHTSYREVAMPLLWGDPVLFFEDENPSLDKNLIMIRKDKQLENLENVSDEDLKLV